MSSNYPGQPQNQGPGWGQQPQQYPVGYQQPQGQPGWGQQPPKKKGGVGKAIGFGCGGFVVVVFIFIIIGSLASSGGGGNSTSGSPATPVTSSAAQEPTQTKKAEKPKTAAPAKTLVQQFKEYAAKNGTPNEAAAVKHVTKIQGADEVNDILDSPSVYTDYSGDMFSSNANKAKLIAVSFVDWQQSRGKDSKNGLVTVYSASAELLSTENY